MRIVIVRHGISEFNIKEKGDNPFFCGAYNTPLAESGKEMARKLQDNRIIKNIEKAYASDLDRAIETAKLAKPNTDIIIDKNLRERSLGRFENYSQKLIRERYPEYFPEGKAKFRHDFKLKAPGGENYTDVCNRCKAFLNSLNLLSNETIGVFSHMHFIRCFIYILANISEQDLLKLKIPNCEPIVFEGNEIGKFKCISHNIEDFFENTTQIMKNMIK